jgi:hypothetical protein
LARSFLPEPIIISAQRNIAEARLFREAVLTWLMSSGWPFIFGLAFFTFIKRGASTYSKKAAF